MIVFINALNFVGASESISNRLDGSIPKKKSNGISVRKFDFNKLENRVVVSYLISMKPNCHTQPLKLQLMQKFLSAFGYFLPFSISFI